MEQKTGNEKVYVIATLKIPTYECKVRLIVTSELVKDVNKLLKKIGQDPVPDEAAAWTICDSIHTYYLIIDIKYLTYNTISHELYHLANKITRDRDIEDEEAAAWVSGHLGDFVYKTLDKKKLTIKHG